MVSYQSTVMRTHPVWAALIVLFWSVCGVQWTSPAHADIAVGEEHQEAFPADQTLELVEDVLRGEGMLFDVQPDKTIVTLWKPADNPAGFFSSLAGMKPRYRYEITVVPEGGSKSRLVVNVRTEYVPEQEVAKYKASTRFDMFRKIDELAATLLCFPTRTCAVWPSASPATPTTGRPSRNATG